MIILMYKGIEVDACEKCGSVWFDVGEIEDLLGRIGASADAPGLAFLRGAPLPAGKERRLCPRCDEAMVQHRAPTASGEAGDLIVDQCPRGHGVWFDRGEFRRLLECFQPSEGAQDAVAFLHEMFAGALESSTDNAS